MEEHKTAVAGHGIAWMTALKTMFLYMYQYSTLDIKVKSIGVLYDNYFEIRFVRFKKCDILLWTASVV
jgi:hypothetical protein